MADVTDRVQRFRAAAEVLAEDAIKMSSKLRACIKDGEYQRAEEISARLQQTARDVKWLMQRQPRKNPSDSE